MKEIVEIIELVYLADDSLNINADSFNAEWDTLTDF